MFSVRRILILLITFASLSLPTRGADDSAPIKAPRLKILFLGDNGHHTPLLRLRDVYTTFSLRGIDFTYTDRLQDLTPENLNRYDAFFVYAFFFNDTATTEKNI